ncbi:MAG: hypothetical protein WC732_01460 [Candidatus Omnitrophota bacterium]
MRYALIFFIAVLLIFAVVHLTWPSELSDIASRKGMGYRLAWVTGKDEDKDADWEHNLNFTFGLSRYIAAQVEGGLGTDYEGGADSYTLSADVQFRAPIENTAPYVFAGGGVHSSTFDETFNIKDTCFGRVGAGFEYFFSRTIAGNTEGLFTIKGGDDTFNGWQLRMGIKFYT